LLPGVSFRETLSGNYWRLDAPVDERAITVTLDEYTTDLADLVRKRILRVKGTIDAEKLASRRELEGTVTLKLIGERRIPYRFAFQGDDGRRYELGGQKEWSPLAPIDSVTLLVASLYDELGQEMGRATLRFDARSEWTAWLRSLRVHW
jgi:hypothetical protein